MERQFIKIFRLDKNTTLVQIEEIMLSIDCGGLGYNVLKNIEGYSVGEKALKVFKFIRN